MFTNRRSKRGGVISSIFGPFKQASEFLHLRLGVCIFSSVTKKSGLSLALSILLISPSGFPPEPENLSSSFDYTPLERLLHSCVDDRGFVNYIALKQNRADLDHLIQQMARVSPVNSPQLFPTHEARLAYWINAYNAWVLRIVVDHYPTSSITKIGWIPYSAFFIRRVQLGGKKLTLRSLENHVIRAGFHDARIHFAINCASRSCPPLAGRVYRPETLDEQLDAAARAFINDNRQVTLDDVGHKIVLSKIFDWYASDFREAYPAKFQKDGTVLDYLKLYLTPERQAILQKLSGAKVSYYDYDWGLNDQAQLKGGS